MKRFLTLAAVLALTLALLPLSATAEPETDARTPDPSEREVAVPADAELAPELREALEQRDSGHIEVVVRLRADSLAATYAQGVRGEAQRAQEATIGAQQDRVVDRALGRDRTTRELARVQAALNAVVLEVPVNELAALAEDPDVERIDPVRNYERHLPETVPHIEADPDDDLPAGVDGEGVTVAVLDTGVDYTHVAFEGSGDIEDWCEAYGCETENGDIVLEDGKPVPDPLSPNNRQINPELFPTASVTDGFDFIGEFWPDGDLRPNPNPIDVEGHGTNVADITAGRTTGAEGVAPAAEIWAVRVCGSFTPACSGTAILQGIDWAMSPAGDPEFGDRTDVINLSLGLTYGTGVGDPIADSLAAATDIGILVVASQGNSSDNPYVGGTPAGEESTFAVAWTTYPGEMIDTLFVADTAPPVDPEEADVVAPAVHQPWSADFDFTFADDEVFHDDSTAARRLGCRLDEDGNSDLTEPNPFDDEEFDGEIVLVYRGACTFSEKIANIALAGGGVGIIAQNTPDAPFTGGLGDCPGDACDDIPGFMIFQSDGDAIVDLLDEPEDEVLGLMDPELGVDVTGAANPATSRGPSFLNLIKPEIGAPGSSISADVATGDGTRQFGGTSGAAPMVSGAAALLIDYARGAEQDRSPAELKASLMNTAEREVFLTPLEPAFPFSVPDLEAFELAPVSRVGGGEVRVGPAVDADAAAWDAERPDRGAALSFGMVDLPGSTLELTRSVTVRNYAAEERTFDIATEHRYTEKQERDAVTVTASADSLTVPADGEAQFDVALSITAANLPDYGLTSGLAGDFGTLLTDVEFDGFVLLSETEATGDAELGLPWHVIPRAASDVSADPDALTMVEGGTDEVTLTNDGVGDALVESFDWLDSRDASPSDETFAGTPAMDLAALGARQFVVGDGCAVYHEFAVTMHERLSHANMPAGVFLELDATGDGQPDGFAFNGPGLFIFPGLIDHVNLTLVADAEFNLVALYFSGHQMNTKTVVLPLCAGDLGLGEDDLGATIDVTASTILYSDRFYVGGELSGSIELGANQFEPTDSLDVPAGDSTVAEWLATGADGTAQGVMAVLTGDGYDRLSGAPADNEVLYLDADVEPAPVLEALEVTPSEAEIEVGATQQFSATAIYDDESTQDVTAEATWASDDADVATVDDEGLATGVSVGEATITATYEEESDAATLTVVEVPVVPDDEVFRLFGDDRIETAIEISQATFADHDANDDDNTEGAFAGRHEQDLTADSVVLARSTDFPDALAGTPLAEAVGAPILLTPSAGLDDRVAAEIQRILAPGGTVHLLGGTAALRAEVEAAVDDLGYETNRIAGATRFETAVAIADVLDRDTIMITTGVTFPDALAAGAAAAESDAAVLLTTSDRPHPAVDGYLTGLDEPTVYAVGGPAARAYTEAEPVFGPTREDTAVEVAEAFFEDPEQIGVARRDAFPDALAGGAHIGRLGGPLLLTLTGRLHEAPESYVCANAESIHTGFIYGGTAAVSDATADALAARMAGDGCPADNNDND